MIVRTTENHRFHAMSGNLATIRNQSAQVLETLATGKNINRISDNPQGAVSLEKLQASLERNAQYQRNLELIRPWVDFSRVNLEYAGTLLSEACQIAVSHSDGSAADRERETAVMQLDNILQELIDTANASLNGRYVFGGSKADAPPFAETGGDPPVVYNGDDQRLLVNVDAGMTLAYNITGESVFVAGDGNVDVFQAVTDLKTALENNDAAGIQAQSDILAQACDQVQLGVSRTGAIAGRMELSESRLSALETRVSARISDIQDADLAKLAAEYYMTEVALQAAYSVSSQIKDYSLINFLE